MRSLLAVTPTGFPGGAESALLRLAGWLGDDGWEVTVAGPGGPLADLVRAEERCQWVELPELKLPSGPKTIGAPIAGARWFAAGRAIRMAARNREADVVVANGLYALPALRRAHLRLPVVHLVRDVLTQRAWRLFLRLGPVATISIAPSETAARPLLERGLAVRVVRHGTAWPVEPARHDPASPSVVGVAASLTPWKGQDVLLDAVARLGRSDVAVELAGGTYHKDTAFAQRLRERAARPDLAGRVRFIDYDPDVVERMRSWDVATSPSVQPESGGLALLEAMSIGVPAVASNHGGPAEVLGEAGLLVAPGDAGELAAAIGRLLGDRALYERCARAGPRLVESRFTLDHERRELLAVLDDVREH